ncbi:MAG: hypothetical protein ABFS46_01295 [Myxococcota bacterium]
MATRGEPQRIRRRWPHPLVEAADEFWLDVEYAHMLFAELTSALARSPPAELRELSPVRCLLLARVGRASGLGLTPIGLKRAIPMAKGTLAYHLAILERLGLVWRRPQDIYDGRKVAVRLTRRGVAAVVAATERAREVRRSLVLWRSLNPVAAPDPACGRCARRREAPRCR